MLSIVRPSSAEGVRRVMEVVMQHSHRQCPAHCNGSASTAAHFDATKADYAFEVVMSTMRYGQGVVGRELPFDVVSLASLAARKHVAANDIRVAVFTDKSMSRLKPVLSTLSALEGAGLRYDVFDGVTIEPTETSVKNSGFFLQKLRQSAQGCQAIVAVGGGSVLDTAKGANLLSAPGVSPDQIMDYVNAPVGKAKPVLFEELLPLIAIPTTTGTGSETTGTVVFDIANPKAKTGITNRNLRPNLALLDPDFVESQPVSVATYSGFDMLCHALESYTAIPYDKRMPRPLLPTYRPTYQGSNPISDLWAKETLRIISENFRRGVDGAQQSRTLMHLAACYAGMGIGNAGCHLAHAMSYAVSGHVRDFHAPDYPTDKPLIPHGLSVVVNAPAVFHFTGAACPERHLEAARLLGGTDISPTAKLSDAGAILADCVRSYMFKLGIPNGISALGYTKDDVDKLVAATLPQQRLTKLSPIAIAGEHLSELFNKSMTVY